LEHYLAYRERGAAEFSDPRRTEGADLEQRLQWLREFRRAWFGPEIAERLFREEEDAVAVRLAMRRVGSDPNLDQEARLQEAAALEEQHPESVRAARERAAAPLLHAREERALRDAGAGEAEIHALRVERFGPDAAERMRTLDAERAAWGQRLATYRAERDAVLVEAHDPDSAEAGLEALRAAHFQPEERERVRLLDRVEALQAERDAP
jgi:lipase chaperone LimK